MDEAGFLRDVDELGSGGDTAIRFAPTQERFQARDLEGVEGDLRLEHQHQVASLHGLAQRLLQAEALRGGVVERSLIESEAISSQLLGAEQGDIRGAE